MSTNVSPGKLKKKLSTKAKPKELTPEQRARLQWKTEAAKALGLWDKVAQVGWGGLTAAETGRIGGWITKMRRQQKGQHASNKRGETCTGNG